MYSPYDAKCYYKEHGWKENDSGEWIKENKCHHDTRQKAKMLIEKRGNLWDAYAHLNNTMAPTDLNQLDIKHQLEDWIVCDAMETKGWVKNEIDHWNRLKNL